MPDSFLFVSQHKSLKEYKPILKKRFPEIFMEYIGETLMEKNTGQYFPYNNYKENSSQNGFYVYRFSRIDSVEPTSKNTGDNQL